MNTGKQWLIRIFAGGVIGAAVLYLVGGLFHALLHGGLGWGGPAFLPVSPDLTDLVGSKSLAALIQFCLYFAFGAVVGVATLPFADEGGALALRSLIHFAVTAGLFSAIVWLCGWAWSRLAWLAELALLALAYLLIWLIRWIVWYVELCRIRKALGLEGQRGKKENRCHEADKAL